MLFIRKLHKWLGLLVGLQLLLWTVSGLMFAWLDHHEVSAEHSVRSVEPAAFSFGAGIAEPAAWLGDRNGALYEIRLTWIPDRWVWRVESADGVELRSIEHGAPLELGEASIRRLAMIRYAGDGELESILFQPKPGIEARSSVAVWRAEFDDAQRTTLYFAADDGRLVASRTSSWRLFDFFWMLHTMDYQGRDNFNNPLVITVGAAALWLSLSGFILLFRSFGRADFRFLSSSRQRCGSS